MPAYVFVLGRAGSGKSAATRHMKEQMKEQGWVTNRITDYDILYSMFLAEKGPDQKFRPTEHGGFDVLNFSVLDDALVTVQKRAKAKLAESDRAFVTIEFARNDYNQAWPIFDPAFLWGAYFLFIDANHDICKARIHRRIHEDPTNLDNHFVSDLILDEYYNKQSYNVSANKDFLIASGIDPARIQTIHNNQEEETEFLAALDAFLEIIIRTSCDLAPSAS
jgi:hypothetical protein